MRSRPSAAAIGAYLTACAVFVLFGGYQTILYSSSTLTSPGIERAYFERLIASHDRDYLYALRDTHLGCKTIAYRDPDVVFLGDSHSYAGWDYPLLQDELRPAVVGNCALAGMFPENADDFLHVLAAGSLRARYVVFEIQPRMFWDVPERPDRVLRARKQIGEIATTKESLGALLTGKWRQIDPFLGAEAVASAKIARLARALDGIDEATIDRALDDNVETLYALHYWTGFVREGSPFARLPAVVEGVCRSVRAARVHFGVVYVPESRWLNEHYTDEQRSQFRADAALFGACADWVDLSAFDQRGYDNRYFVNRYLVDDYPYNGWNNPPAALAWIGESPQERRWQLFDPDHMSAVGAHTFSRAFAKRLQRWVAGAPS